ncbi:MAG: protein-export chaperone SecB [Alphaproteobacteria bacterium]|nr:protein-export chaperone SecB [Alphaproteobacteria bacterium]
MPVTIHTQYVRDLSFENPNAPASFRVGAGAPEMDVNIAMDARKLEDPEIENLYEVVLIVTATATRGEQVVFIAEMAYGVMVSIDKAVPEDQHHPILLIEIPRFAFPFCRQILSTTTSQGGYPPLLLNPVDFQALYIQRFKEDLKDDLEANQTVN